MPTFKGFAQEQFYEALRAYRVALETGSGIVAASIAVHAASGAVGVTPAMRSLIRKTFKENVKLTFAGSPATIEL